MAFLRSERYAAFLLIGAAILGLVIANSPLVGAFSAAKAFHFGIPAIGIDLSIGHWITDGLLAIFFFIAAIELKHELTHGELDSPAKALVPTIAAIGGVVVPAAVYLLIAGSGDLASGWPIPTATDIAFALGVLAIVGKGLPSRIRVLLLALAVIDDLIAILIIAAFFTKELQPLPLVLAVPVILVFGWLSYRARRSGWVVVALIALGILAWALVYLSGIHPTVAGVALGLIMAGSSAGPTRRAIEPWSNGIILPVFAFAAALVPLPSAGIANLSPAFWAIIVALPVGKLIGITGGALIASSVGKGGRRVPVADLVAVAALGGIGFTVSLLMNELAFADHPEIANEGTLAVLIASVIAALIGVVLTLARARHYRSLSPADPS
ncbi:MAG: Na+/H+ antiporter NhaA [Rhodoglobus sp.]